jgi:flagellar basal body rod protein FlgG
MDNLTVAAASGIRSRMESLDLLANNLANSSTSGFKNDRAFYGLYASVSSDDGVSGNPSSTVPVIEHQWTDFSPGDIQVTSNSLDMALKGPGFFVVNGPNGPLYTRNGSLQILPSGDLAVADGYPLAGAEGATIKANSSGAIEISRDGTVSQGGSPIGQLQIVDFKSTSSLAKQGRTCFKNTDPKNPPGPVTGADVQQGKIEGSNVPVAQAAMRLVEVMRQFDMLQKAVGVSNDMDMKAIQEVARVGS